MADKSSLLPPSNSTRSRPLSTRKLPRFPCFGGKMQLLLGLEGSRASAPQFFAIQEA